MALSLLLQLLLLLLLLLVVAIAYDEKLDKSEKAVEYFKRAQDILPQDPAALVALGSALFFLPGLVAAVLLLFVPAVVPAVAPSDAAHDPPLSAP